MKPADLDDYTVFGHSSHTDKCLNATALDRNPGMRTLIRVLFI